MEGEDGTPVRQPSLIASKIRLTSPSRYAGPRAGREHPSPEASYGPAASSVVEVFVGLSPFGCKAIVPIPVGDPEAVQQALR